MPLRNTPDRYGAVAQALHWATAALIVAMVVVGWVMEDLPLAEKMPGSWGYDLYQLHKSFGFVVLALAVLRLAWRVVSPAPPVPARHGRALVWAAHASHIALYALIFAMPLSGWLFVSADPLSHTLIPTRFFDLFTVPNLLDADADARDRLRGLHGLLSNLLIAVVALHAAAALAHHVFFRDNVLIRMLPFARLRPER
ncbi:MAG: cytochrome b [Alphaproteobacteria bacterium]